MSHLRAANVEKSFSVLRDFCDAVALEEVSPELEEKKQMAEKALDHLGRIFDGNESGLSSDGCNGVPSSGSPCTSCKTSQS